MFYGTSVWDPALIIAQIVAIQSLFYISLGFLLMLSLGPIAPRLSLFYFFDYSAISAHSLMGWMVIAAHLVNAALGAGYLALVVERAKKCLDFTATLYFLHLLFCCAFRGWPRSFEWWLLNVTGMILMAVLGEWLCLRKEMRDIPLVSGVGGQAARPPPPPGRSMAALSAIATSAKAGVNVGRNMLAGSLAPGREQPAP